MTKEDLIKLKSRVFETRRERSAFAAMNVHGKTIAAMVELDLAMADLDSQCEEAELAYQRAMEEFKKQVTA